MTAAVIDPNHLPARLRELRLRAELSQGDLAKRAGVSQSIIDTIERGSSSPRYVAVCALANALGVTLTELGKPPSKKQPKARPRGNPLWVKKQPPADGPGAEEVAGKAVG